MEIYINLLFRIIEMQQIVEWTTVGVLRSPRTFGQEMHPTFTTIIHLRNTNEVVVPMRRRLNIVRGGSVISESFSRDLIEYSMARVQATYLALNSHHEWVGHHPGGEVELNLLLEKLPIEWTTFIRSERLIITAATVNITGLKVHMTISFTRALNTNIACLL